MAYDSKVIEVMIASPGDVTDERAIVRELIIEWNALHSRQRQTVLLPMGWDTHSSPELGGRPQQMINDRLLKHADVVVGIFWTRLGTPTGKSSSGTVEEVREHHAAGKPVMLYFSDKPVVPSSIDQLQYEELQKFKNWARQQGLVESVEDLVSFRDNFRRHLQIMLDQNPYIASLADVNLVAAFEDGLKPDPVALTSQGEQVLRAAASADGYVLIARTIGGTTVEAGQSSFGDEGSPRESARWIAAVEDLERFRLIKSTRNRDVYEITNAGYQYIEDI